MSSYFIVIVCILILISFPGSGSKVIFLKLLLSIPVFYFLVEKILKKELEYKKNIKNLFSRLIKGEYPENKLEFIEEEYQELVRSLKERKKCIEEKENNIDEKVIESNYNDMLARHTEVEYINAELKGKITSLMQLNAFGKSVLAELEIEKIISIIFDGISVLTNANKMCIFLWNDGKLEKKSFRGKILEYENKTIEKERIKSYQNEIIPSEYIIEAGKILGPEESVVICTLGIKEDKIGAIFIIEDSEENAIRKEKLELLHDLTINFSIAINNAILYSGIKERERISKEISIAADIQRSLLPQNLRTAFGLDIASYFEPAKEIGGDYYGYFISAEGKFGVSVGDVSGKGMPAALLMTFVRSVLITLASYDTLPDAVLTRLNKIISQDISNEMFVTLFYSLYDYETYTLYYSNAGHDPLLLCRQDEEEVIDLWVKGVAVGFLDSYNYKLKKEKLNYGDVLVYYTDGITEAKNSENMLYGINNLKQVIKENKNLSAEEIKNRILNSVFEFRGNYEQTDDITLIVMKLKR